MWPPSTTPTCSLTPLSSSTTSRGRRRCRSRRRRCWGGGRALGAALARREQHVAVVDLGRHPRIGWVDRHPVVDRTQGCRLRRGTGRTTTRSEREAYGVSWSISKARMYHGAAPPSFSTRTTRSGRGSIISPSVGSCLTRAPRQRAVGEAPRRGHGSRLRVRRGPRGRARPPRSDSRAGSRRCRGTVLGPQGASSQQVAEVHLVPDAIRAGRLDGRSPAARCDGSRSTSAGSARSPCGSPCARWRGLGGLP